MRSAALILLAGLVGLAQPLSSAHVAWPTPETVVRDLRSEERGIRTNALKLLGLPVEQAIHFDGVDQIDLKYVALGEDSEQQAVLCVQRDSLTYAAVVAPHGSGWERIALFECWCKYDTDNALGRFVQIHPTADGRNELVVHDSGGGTGLYEQTESHYRVRHADIRRVLSFESRRRSCPGEGPCEIRVRWFSDKTLVEARGTIDPDKAPTVAGSA
jgi:hypothetical protein